MAEKKQEKKASGFTLADIAKIAETAAMQCYGVVDLSSSDSFKDMLKKGKTSGAVVRQKRDSYEIDLYIIVGFGVRITEVVFEVQKKVKFDLERQCHLPFSAINVYVQSVRTL